MRAHWVPELSVQPEYLLKSETLHHLLHVIRVRLGEELLLLNGEGLQVLTRVKSISKKTLELEYISSSTATRTYDFDLALGMPKRDALDLCLKEAVELGFRKIFLVKSVFSQMKAPEPARLSSLLVSALEQSNSAFLPQVEALPWETIPWESYSNVVLMDSQSHSESKTLNKAEGSQLLIIGPEGGFSESEFRYFKTKSNLTSLHLPTPILRTPTALATGAGMLLQTLLD